MWCHLYSFYSSLGACTSGCFCTLHFEPMKSTKNFCLRNFPAAAAAAAAPPPPPVPVPPPPVPVPPPPVPVPPPPVPVPPPPVPVVVQPYMAFSWIRS
uniref:Uncharacterized protein n=1 Tax=Ciona intestinalis TaxID=7719 RepID=H2XYE7_CIOIN